MVKGLTCLLCSEKPSGLCFNFLANDNGIHRVVRSGLLNEQQKHRRVYLGRRTGENKKKTRKDFEFLYDQWTRDIQRHIAKSFDFANRIGSLIDVYCC